LANGAEEAVRLAVVRVGVIPTANRLEVVDDHKHILGTEGQLFERVLGARPIAR
jgi:hypothetical protein